MPALRIGAHALPDVEVLILKAIVNLLSPHLGGRWQFVAGAPYDVLVTEGDVPPGRADTSLATARAVLRLCSGGMPDAADALRRPLRADVFRDWLTAREQEWRAKEMASPPPAAAPTPTAPSPRVRLRRWPPMLVLHNDPVRIRIATMLMRQFLSLRDIVLLSGQNTDVCKRFLKVLEDAGLLITEVSAPPPQAAAEAQPTPKKGLGALLGSIRRRLGL